MVVGFDDAMAVGFPAGGQSTLWHPESGCAEMARRFLNFQPNRKTYSIGLCPLEADGFDRRFLVALGVSLSQTLQQKVLVVSTNKNDHTLEGYCSVPCSPGLDEMLQAPPFNRFDTIHPSRFPYLSVLPAGGRHNALPERELWERIGWMHQLVQPHFRAVVVEYPAIEGRKKLESSYCLPDSMFLVVPQGVTGRQVRKALHALQATGANVAATILAGAGLN